MFRIVPIRFPLQLFIGSVVCLFQAITYAQEVTVINHKGTHTKVRNNVVSKAASAPIAPLQNDVWFDTATGLTKIYDGTAWLDIESDLVTTSSSVPSSPKSGDIWLDTSDTDHYRVKIWDGTNWIELIFTGTAGSVFFADTDGKPTQNN